MASIGLVIVVIGVVIIVGLLLWCCLLFKTRSSAEQDLELQSIPQKQVDINSQILSLQDEIKKFTDKEKDKDQILDIIRNAQVLVESARTNNEETVKNCLIIGVDARPKVQAGYCINLFDKSIRYYVIKREDFPWLIHGNNQDSSEFEMKNLVFALTVWREQIVQFQRVYIYTDNSAITRHSTDKYGLRAKEYLNHFERCEGVTILNKERMAVDKNRDLETFAKFIQPADDLSRWRINMALEFLTRMYQIGMENVKGTHCQSFTQTFGNQERQTRATSKPWYKQTAPQDWANAVISKNLSCGNSGCSSVVTSSLKRKE